MHPVPFQAYYYVMNLLGPGVICGRQERYRSRIPKTQDEVEHSPGAVEEEVQGLGMIEHPFAPIVPGRVQKGSSAGRQIKVGPSAFLRLQG